MNSTGRLFISDRYDNLYTQYAKYRNIYKSLSGPYYQSSKNILCFYNANEGTMGNFIRDKHSIFH